jgi:ferric-dicitrate binding protein FerR (iron transport regulator)
MSQIDNIISKVVSGNGSESDKVILTKWIEECEENNNIYKQRLALWQFVGKVEKIPEVNIVAAWDKFNMNKENFTQKEKKSYLYYKIAAVFIVLLVSASIIFMFNSNSKLDNSQEFAVKTNSIQKIKSNDNVLLVNTSSVDKISNYKRFQKRKDTSLTHEIILEDSSVALISKTSVLSFLNNSESHTRIASLSGAGLFDISSFDKDFVLETEQLKIIVQGTKFNITTADEDSKFVEISVEEGFMEVSEKLNPDNKVIISSKQKFIYDIEKHTFTEVKSKATTKWQRFIKKFQKNN